jgi:hypothetical protein
MQGREGYAPIATICVYRGGVGWCMGGAEIGTVAREGDEWPTDKRTVSPGGGGESRR